MTSRTNLGYQGVRSGLWARSKWTNTARFDPGGSEIDQVTLKYDYSNNVVRTDGPVRVIKEPTHPSFIMPVDEISVLEALRTVPSHFTKGLDTVLLLRGNRKQEKSFKRSFYFGRYHADRIFLHPFPRKFMFLTYSSQAKPNLLNDYERAGAKVSLERKCWHVQFDEESLKRFYLLDVLMHELGHHVDSPNFQSKSHKKAEGFAEWFASEYGYRLARLGRRDE